MTRTHDLIVFLAKAGKSFKEIRETVEAAYPGQALGKSQVYRVMKVMKEDRDKKYKRGSDNKKTVRTPDFIDSIRADIEEDRRLTISQLAKRYGSNKFTIHQVLTKDLGLSKKSAR